MGQIGNIKEIAITSGQITCVVDIANGGEKTATIFGLAGVDVYPMPGDEVMIDYCSGEWIVSAVFRDAETEQGETIIYSRDSDGVVVASVHVKKNGEVLTKGKAIVNTTDDAAALASILDSYLSVVDGALSSWTVLANDGGAALQTAYNTAMLAAFPTGLPTVAAENLKVDK